MKIYPFLLFLLILASTSTPSAHGQCHIGSDTTDTYLLNGDNFNGNTVLGIPVTISNPITITSLHAFIVTPHGATNIKMAIYDDENNAPKNIIAETAVASFTSPNYEKGIVSIPLSPTLLHLGTYCGLCYTMN